MYPLAKIPASAHAVPAERPAARLSGVSAGPIVVIEQEPSAMHGADGGEDARGDTGGDTGAVAGRPSARFMAQVFGQHAAVAAEGFAPELAAAAYRQANALLTVNRSGLLDTREFVLGLTAIELDSDQ